MYQTDVKIISNKKISKDFFLLTFAGEKIARYSKPGQFVMINPALSGMVLRKSGVKIGKGETFFRRPFSICGVNNGRFDVLFKVVGKGTELLSGTKCGDIFNIIGPLGNGYPLPVTRYPLPVLVAGGTGIASLLFLARQLTAYGLRLTVFIGARTKKEIMFEKELKKRNCKVIVSTEDGSYGKKGLITDVFALHLSSLVPPASPAKRGERPSSLVYACGPRPMLEKVSKMCGKYDLKCFVSLEEKMACGIGACMGCVGKVRTKNSEIRNKNFEYKRVCKDGPVFDAREIIW